MNASQTPGSDRPDVGRHGQEYLALHDARYTLLRTADDEDDIQARSAALRSAGRAAVEMEFYEDEPATLADLRRIADYQPAGFDDEVEGRRERLLALLDDPSHHLGSLVLDE